MKSKYRLQLLLTAVLFLGLQATFAQKKDFTYNHAYLGQGERLSESMPRLSGWLDDTYYLESEYSREGFKIMKVDAVKGTKEVHIDYAQFDEKLPEGFSFQSAAATTDDRNSFVFRKDNNLHYFSITEGELRQITDSEATENNPRFSPDGQKVAFTREHDLYVVDVQTGRETRLTHDGSELIYNGWASWVYYEEILGRGSRYAAFWWAPDSKKVAFLRFDDSTVPEFFITWAEGKNGRLEQTRYPKAGDPNPFVKLGVAHIDEAKVVWMDTREDEDRYVAWPYWTKNSEKLYYQFLNRDQNELVIYSTNPSTGDKTEVYREEQETWIEFFKDIYFFEDESGFLLRSDKSGWMNLYYYAMDGELIAKVTDVDWRVTGISQVVEKKKEVYFQGTGGESTESHLFKVKLDGSKLTQLTETKGSHRASVSPGGKYFYTSYSNIHQPTKIDLFTTRGKLVRNIADSYSDAINNYNMGKVELFTIPSGDGFDLPAVWVLPPDYDENKRYPVILSIYGGPDAGSVSNSYRGSLREQFLAQNGIITIAVDHRSSGHFGKKGMNYMHRNLGKWEMHDYGNAIQWMIDQGIADPDRIGITGHSYGGYMTCLALTMRADIFTCGWAGAPVTTWRLYDNVYTERYMDTPQDNEAGYEFGSCLTYADQLKGQLMINHGEVDDNVHLQNTIWLIGKFQDLNKDFGMMIYPGGRHGWGGAKRRHSDQKSVEFWFKNLLNGKELVIE